MRVYFFVRFIFLIFLFALSIFSVTYAQEYEQGGITLSRVWARATPLGSKVGVAYLKISVKKGSPDTLLSVSSPVAAKVEIHTHIQEDGIVKMRHLEKLALAGGKTILFEPSGLHLMLIDLNHQLKEGERLPLTMLFEKAGAIKVEAKIEPIGSRSEATKDRK